ncbi:MAG: (2Fe-2S)-binding protein [Pseudomonadota bacterium]
MYICICNAIRERQLRDAANDATRVEEVFRKCGHRPQCGKCVPDIAKMITNNTSQRRKTALPAT